MEYIDVALCKQCPKVSTATGYEKDDRQKCFRTFTCSISSEYTGVEILTSNGDDTNKFQQEPDSAPPKDCPYLLEHVLKGELLKKTI